MSHTAPVAKRLIVLSSGILVAALALSGCASSSPSSSTPATKSSSSSVPVLPYNKKLADMVPASVRQQGALTFGASAFPPYVDLNTDGTYSGLTIDMLKQFESILKLKINVQTVNFATSMTDVQSGRIDITGPAGDFVERQSIVDFADMAKDNVTVLVKKTDDFTPSTNAALCGTTLGVQTGAGTTQVMAAVNAQCTAKGKSPASVSDYADLSQATLALTSGRIQGVVAPVASNSLAARSSNGTMRVITIAQMQTLPAATATYGIQTKRGNKLASAFVAALQEMATRGTYKALFVKWGIPLSALTPSKIHFDGSTQNKNS